MCGEENVFRDDVYNELGRLRGNADRRLMNGAIWRNAVTVSLCELADLAGMAFMIRVGRVL